MELAAKQLFVGRENWRDMAGNSPGAELVFNGHDWTQHSHRTVVDYHTNAHLAFRNCRFPSDFRFSKCNFIGNVEFDQCTFEGDFTISSGDIRGNLLFTECNFASALKLTPDVVHMSWHISAGTKIGTSLTINPLRSPSLDLDLDGIAVGTFLTILGDFSSIDLSGALVKGALTYQGSVSRDMDISAARIGGKCEISNSKIGRDLKAEATLFGDDFSCAGSTIVSSLNFINCQLKGKASFQSLCDSEFPACDFSDAEFCGYADFHNREFTGPTVFDGATFNVPPSFHNAKLFSGTSFRNTKFLGMDDPDAEMNFRALRACATSIESHNDEQLFFSYELSARRKQEKNTGTTFLLGAYSALSDNGRSVFRPLFALLAFQVVFLFLYWLVQLSDVGNCSASQSCKLVFDIERLIELVRFTLAQGFSFVPALKEAGQAMIWHSPLAKLIGYFLAIFHIALTFLMLFLIGLGLRNMFRLR